ncbi:hypothetical protein PRNP1_001157 [Phytophthora ramorum]
MGPPSAVDDVDGELGRRLSLSDSAKFAVTLNQLQRVAIRGLFDSPEHDGATLYVVEVYLQKAQQGLPKSNAKRQLLREQERERPECHVVHRYSDFRALRHEIYDVVDVADDQMHPVWCSYCCRVLWLMTYGSFPSRLPNRGVVARISGWSGLLARHRMHKLENFINELLTAAKDQSYRHGNPQCKRFIEVSQLLQAFLLEPQAQTSYSGSNLATSQAMSGSSSEQEDERRSLDAALGRHLSQMSSSAKFAVTLNQISHVAIRAAYTCEEHERIVTVYVLDIFLQDVQKGLPKTPTQHNFKLTWRPKRDKPSERAEYQVEHRYSAFRLLRQRIVDVVNAPSESDQHPQWCAYCSRVLWLVTVGDFPSRYPNQGPVATYTGWRQLLVHSRKRGLERFVNELVAAAKDVSYRYSAVQCARYVTVSGLLNDFLGDPHVRTAVSSTASSCC